LWLLVAAIAVPGIVPHKLLERSDSQAPIALPACGADDLSISEGSRPRTGDDERMMSASSPAIDSSAVAHSFDVAPSAPSSAPSRLNSVAHVRRV